MKAVILAGGKGTRGKPYTNFFPKAMTPIQDKPLIEYVVHYLASFDFIKEIIIISDFKGLGGQIKNYLQDLDISKKLYFVQDAQRGTGGDLLSAESILKKSPEFLLWFVDNLCAIDLKKMLEGFRKKKIVACVATRTKRKEETGFALVEDGLVLEFKEKPVIEFPLHECLGIYILNKNILQLIKKNPKKEINLSFDILQDLAKKKEICAFDIGNKNWIDVESPVTLERNSKTVKKIIKQMER